MARPIKVALVPEFPGCTTHPAQAAAVRQAGAHLRAAGYVCEEILPPDLERAVLESARVRCTPDFKEGLAAFLEKRKPMWQSDAEER